MAGRRLIWTVLLAALALASGAGGVVTPYAGDSTSFVEEWKKLSRLPRGPWYWGFG